MASPPPKPPNLPPKPDAPQPGGSGSWLSLLLAGSLLIAVLVGLFFVSLGSILGPVIFALLVLPAVALFHYLVWGWWLGKMLLDEAAEEEE